MDVDIPRRGRPSAQIMLVTDGTVTMGDDIVIARDKIKVVGLPQPDGSTNSGIGAFFIPEFGISTSV